jgi:hypothetical protein
MNESINIREQLIAKMLRKSQNIYQLFWLGSILGGSLKRSLGMAKFQEQSNHPHPDERNRDEDATHNRATYQ